MKSNKLDTRIERSGFAASRFLLRCKSPLSRYYPEYDFLSVYGERLKATHLHDNNGSYAQHGLPFEGTLD